MPEIAPWQNVAVLGLAEEAASGSEEAAAACQLLTALGEEPTVIGEVTEREGSDGAQVLFA